MNEGWFDQPVKVLEGLSTVRHVSSAREAAECLLYRWPEKGGRKHLAARKACMAVLAGQKEALAARRAFVKAAEEAQTLVPDQGRKRWTKDPRSKKLSDGT